MLHNLATEKEKSSSKNNNEKIQLELSDQRNWHFILSRKAFFLLTQTCIWKGCQDKAGKVYKSSFHKILYPRGRNSGVVLKESKSWAHFSYNHNHWGNTLICMGNIQSTNKLRFLFLKQAKKKKHKTEKCNFFKDRPNAKAQLYFI